jgi:AcrR family transcriptional regulator
MAWDTEGTKQRILDAAVVQFADHGPDGTTVERIAAAAGVNKERVYNYFGGKRALFDLVLSEELAAVAHAVPSRSFAEEDIGEYAGRVYDYHRQRPALTRLLRWESLMFDGECPDEAQRRRHYEQKTAAVADGQERGAITGDIDADHLIFLILSLSAWWFTAPQVARMVSGADSEAEHARRRTSVVLAARRLATR